MSLRKTDKQSGRAVDRQSSAQGEGRRDARREREIRDVQVAINKGHRNDAITNFFKK